MAACVTAAVEADVDVIVTGAVPEDRIATALIHASRAKIPVLFTQTAPTGRGYPAEVGYLSPDHAEQQGWLAEWVVADSGGTGSVLVVQLIDTPAMQAWVQDGALPVYDACPGCTTSLLEVTTGQLDELPALVEKALAASPATRYVHVTMDVAVDAAVQGIEATGRTDVLVVGQDGTPEVLEQVTPDGPVGAVAGFDHTAMGW
ncbi:sugar ABC transporter substrate-binding protein [Ornithinimicrobium sp. W1679]|uniref:sugar ABC transporter substrate-binding protein n=1 Tax=Ornithinimicrobium sp. W1679 TaxID=3418770 RepID=UPI003CFB428C